MDIAMPVGVDSSAHCSALTPSVCPARLFIVTHGQMRRHLSRVEAVCIASAAFSGRRRYCRLATSNKIDATTNPAMMR